jgi:Xaa-Pro aminopeptidase
VDDPVRNGWYERRSSTADGLEDLVTSAEYREKRRRLLDLLDAQALDALVLRRPANLSWYSGGGRFHIVSTPEIAVADLVVTRAGEQLVTTANEAERLREEELGNLSVELVVLPWTQDRREALPTGARVGYDLPMQGDRDVSHLVELTRRSLTSVEVDRFRTLGRDSAMALTEACTAIQPRHTEQDAAAYAAAALLKRSIDPIVLLVAGEERLPHYRHPLPTTALLGRIAMVVVCARRGGLVASLTRLVSFGRLPDHANSVHARLLEIDSVFLQATKPGRAISDVFRDGVAAYERQGFSPDEWQRHHHQGGPTGYEPRDFLADFESDSPVEVHQAFAWNPTVSGTKSEDTILAGNDGPEILTADPCWPSSIVAGLPRPLVLER